LTIPTYKCLLHPTHVCQTKTELDGQVDCQAVICEDIQERVCKDEQKEE
jgi:hypothetical protein